LQRIGAHIAMDSPSAAERFISSLRADLDKLSPFPFMAQVVGDSAHFREVVIGAVKHSATLK
jgi:toxin ParE1/3/4